MERESYNRHDPARPGLYFPRLLLQITDEAPYHTKAVMCRTGSFKYVKRYYEDDEFYDLKIDPGEINNLISSSEYREKILEHKEIMLNWYMGTCDTVPRGLIKDETQYYFLFYRSAEMGHYGGIWTSPGYHSHLDKAAEKGTLFEKAFTPQPVCGPARSCLQTGKFATETGCHVNNRMLPVNEKTMAHYLSGAGYETAYIGKWHLADKWTGGQS